MSGKSHDETTAEAGMVTQEEQASSTIRVAVLIVFTLFFASLWSQVQPDPVLLAQRERLLPNMSIPLSGPLPARAMVRTESPPAKLVSVEKPAADAAPRPPAKAASRASNLLAINQSLTIVRDGLLLSTDELMQHISQLPMGTPDGDYRMVDSQGGVGWLRVRMKSAFQQPVSADSNVVTTAVHGHSVTFIRVLPGVARETARIVR